MIMYYDRMSRITTQKKYGYMKYPMFPFQHQAINTIEQQTFKTITMILIKKRIKKIFQIILP